MFTESRSASSMLGDDRHATSRGVQRLVSQPTVAGALGTGKRKNAKFDGAVVY
jgi:hypothetical protein